MADESDLSLIESDLITDLRRQLENAQVEKQLAMAKMEQAAEHGLQGQTKIKKTYLKKYLRTSFVAAIVKEFFCNVGISSLIIDHNSC